MITINRIVKSVKKRDLSFLYRVGFRSVKYDMGLGDIYLSCAQRIIDNIKGISECFVNCESDEVVKLYTYKVDNITILSTEIITPAVAPAQQV